MLQKLLADCLFNDIVGSDCTNCIANVKLLEENKSVEQQPYRFTHRIFLNLTIMYVTYNYVYL